MHDLSPATSTLTMVIRAISDDQLEAATPCEQMTVADLIDHADGLAQAFAAAAQKETLPGEQAPRVDGSRIGDDWRERIPARLDALAAAWRDPAAWEGVTSAGGLELPAQVAGLVAINEVIVHGWDLAHATGQPYDADDALVGAAVGFVGQAVADNPNGVPGLFGPAVEAPSGASPLDRLIALTGRDPDWSAVSV